MGQPRFVNEKTRKTATEDDLRDDVELRMHPCPACGRPTQSVSGAKICDLCDASVDVGMGKVDVVPPIPPANYGNPMAGVDVRARGV